MNLPKGEDDDEEEKKEEEPIKPALSPTESGKQVQDLGQTNANNSIDVDSKKSVGG